MIRLYIFDLVIFQRIKINYQIITEKYIFVLDWFLLIIGIPPMCFVGMDLWRYRRSFVGDRKSPRNPDDKSSTHQAFVKHLVDGNVSPATLICGYNNRTSKLDASGHGRCAYRSVQCQSEPARGVPVSEWREVGSRDQNASFTLIQSRNLCASIRHCSTDIYEMYLRVSLPKIVLLRQSSAMRLSFLAVSRASILFQSCQQVHTLMYMP